MTEKHEDGALEKLNRGIQDSRQMVQRQTMELAQEYFDDSAEVLRQQIKESRATLEDMPDQIPGRDEAFQMLFQELMDNYASMERCIDEAQQNVADLDTERFRRQGEVDATDAARRQAREQDLDLTEIEGTGSEGRVVAEDVKSLAQSEELSASDAARRKAQELGVNLSKVEGTGSEGNIVVDDVTSLAESSKEQATGGAGQAAQGAQDAAGQATRQAQDAMGQMAGQLGDLAGQAQDTAGSTVQQTQNAADAAARRTGQATTGDSPEEPKVTSAARRKAEERGVNLSKVEGTGSGGLITLRDVMGS